MPKDKIILVYVQDYSAGACQEHISEECNIPLGILYLGSHLYNNGFKVRLLDTRLQERDNFLKILDKELSDAFLIGFSVMTPNIREALKLSQYVKERSPCVKVIWGGAHPSLFAESTINNRYIDFVIIREGERSLLELGQYLLDHKGSLSNIPDFVYKEDDRVLKNSPLETRDMVGIGVPRYELLNIERYILRRTEMGSLRRQAEVLASRGCPHRCSFCINTVLYGNRWHAYPLEDTLNTIDYLIKKYAIEHIFFMDEDFFCNRQMSQFLILEITKRKISWESNCRADYIREGCIDDAFLAEIKESRCLKLRFGLESGSQRILDILVKGLTIKQSLQAVSKVSGYGIVPSLSFMMGIPGETKTDVTKTLRLILKLEAINPQLDLIGPLIFRPYPGSQLFQECLRRGLRQPHSLDEWSDFYIHNEIDQYRKGFPWFEDFGIFRKVWLFNGHLQYMRKNPFLKGVVYFLLKFHLFTRLWFIGYYYPAYRFIKKVRGYLF